MYLNYKCNIEPGMPLKSKERNFELALEVIREGRAVETSKQGIGKGGREEEVALGGDHAGGGGEAPNRKAH